MRLTSINNNFNIVTIINFVICLANMQQCNLTYHLHQIQSTSLMKISIQDFRIKFNEVDTANSGKLGRDGISQLLRLIDLQQHPSSIEKAVVNFYFYSTRFQLSLNNLPSAKTVTAIDNEDEDQPQQQQQQKNDDFNEEENASSYELSVDEAYKYVDLLLHKSNFQIWKKTCDVHKIVSFLTKKSKTAVFPLKDPRHSAKIKILVGEEQPSYNSYMHFVLDKSPKAVEKQPVSISIKLITASPQESKILHDLWGQIFQMFEPVVEQALPQFLSTIVITPICQGNDFILKVASANKQINQFFETLSNVADYILKTPVKLKLELMFQFNFDLGEFISNENSTIYDFLINNIRFRVSLEGSQYVTSIKQMMIIHKVLGALNDVPDDDMSLMLIWLINIQNFDLALKFNNDFRNQTEQNTLKMFLLLFTTLRAMMVEFQEQMPQVVGIFRNAMKHQILLSAHLCDLNLELDINIPNLDQLLFHQPKIKLDQVQGQGSNNNEESQSQPLDIAENENGPADSDSDV